MPRTTGTTAKADAGELDKIKAALDALVAAAAAHALRQQPADDYGDDDDRLMSVEALGGAFPPGREWDLARVIDDPLGGALHNAMALLGERIFAADGRTDALIECCDDVAALDEDKRCCRAEIIELAWEGWRLVSMKHAGDQSAPHARRRALPRPIIAPQ